MDLLELIVDSLQVVLVHEVEPEDQVGVVLDVVLVPDVVKEHVGVGDGVLAKDADNGAASGSSSSSQINHYVLQLKI